MSFILLCIFIFARGLMLINPEIGGIISLAFAKGKVHDFQLFKSSQIHLKPGSQPTADSGYQGITKLHANSVLPKKSTKNRPLSKQDRKQNRNISRKRIAVEHVIALVKRFRILSESYRNRRKRSRLCCSGRRGRADLGGPHDGLVFGALAHG